MAGLRSTPRPLTPRLEINVQELGVKVFQLILGQHLTAGPTSAQKPTRPLLPRMGDDDLSTTRPADSSDRLRVHVAESLRCQCSHGSAKRPQRESGESISSSQSPFSSLSQLRSAS